MNFPSFRVERPMAEIDVANYDPPYPSLLAVIVMGLLLIAGVTVACSAVGLSFGTSLTLAVPVAFTATVFWTDSHRASVTAYNEAFVHQLNSMARSDVVALLESANSPTVHFIQRYLQQRDPHADGGR